MPTPQPSLQPWLLRVMYWLQLTAALPCFQVMTDCGLMTRDSVMCALGQEDAGYGLLWEETISAL